MTQACDPSLLVPTATYASSPKPRRRLQSNTAWSSESPQPYKSMISFNLICYLLVIKMIASNAIPQLSQCLVPQVFRMG